MDGWGIAILIIGTLGFFVSKKRPGWLFVAGLGAGLLVGAVWSYLIVTRAIDAFAP